ncbi:hypothetical protein [Gelidibacter japonicus]|uniref:hypothetical protein n=1 Tax=Gelidibacter japonicus TaxID=1962232 RepID=UPI003A8D506C
MNPKIRYYLEAKFKGVDYRNTPELIMAEVNYGYRGADGSGRRRNKPFRISLDATILPSNFGLKEKNFKFDEKTFTRFAKTNRTIRTKMGLLESGIDILTNDYILKGIVPEPVEFKKAVKKQLGRVEDNIGSQLIWDYLNEKIKSDEENLKYAQKKGIAEGTIKSYRTLLRHLENYQIATGDVLTFANFDEDKYWHFWNVLNDIFKDKIKVNNQNQPRKQRKNKTGYASSALQRNQRLLLRVLRLAKKKYDLALDLTEETLMLEDSDSMKDFYISEVELQLIKDADVSHSSKLQNAKEYAIIAALTGLRNESMIDTVNVEVEYFNEDGYDFQFIHSKHNKTSTEVIIPLLRPVRDILELNEGVFPKFPVNQIINENLKALFEYVGIDEEVKLTRHTYSDGTKISHVPKHEAVSTHDFKHSFYTNLYIHNVIHPVIDNITHPDRPPKNPMARIYNRSTMIDKAKMFVDEINKIDSPIYKF